MNSSFAKTILLFLFLFFLNIGYTQTQKTIQDPNWFKTLNSTKTVYWPTAFALNKGEHYYQNLYLLWQELHFGVTDKLSLGVSFELASLLFGETTPLFTLSSKYSEPVNDKLNVGIGVWTIFAYDLDYYEGLGVIYGLVSYGTEDNNVTIGMGHGNYLGNWSGIPQLNLGFNKRLGKHGGISGELWLFEADRNEAVSFFSISFKYIGKDFVVDLGLVTDSKFHSDVDFLVPMGSITIPFGKNRNNRN